MLDEQQVDPEPCDLALLDAERGQAERLASGHEDAARMRLEGQDRGGHAVGASAIAGLADQRGMALMQPVEIAHRQHRAARMARSGTGMSDDSEHGYIYRQNSRNCRQSAVAAKIAGDATER